MEDLVGKFFVDANSHYATDKIEPKLGFFKKRIAKVLSRFK